MTKIEGKPSIERERERERQTDRQRKTERQKNQKTSNKSWDLERVSYSEQVVQKYPYKTGIFIG